MTDIRVGDLWGYCDTSYYIVIAIDQERVNLVDIESDKSHENYPIDYFRKTFIDTDIFMWKLLSRPSAGLVEQ